MVGIRLVQCKDLITYYIAYYITLKFISSKEQSLIYKLIKRPIFFSPLKLKISLSVNVERVVMVF